MGTKALPEYPALLTSIHFTLPKITSGLKSVRAFSGSDRVRELYLPSLAPCVLKRAGLCGQIIYLVVLRKSSCGRDPMSRGQTYICSRSTNDLDDAAGMEVN